MAETKTNCELDGWLSWLLKTDVPQVTKIKLLKKRMEDKDEKTPVGMPPEAIEIWVDYKFGRCENAPEIVLDILQSAAVEKELTSVTDEMIAVNLSRSEDGRTKEHRSECSISTGCVPYCDLRLPTSQDIQTAVNVQHHIMNTCKRIQANPKLSPPPLPGPLPEFTTTDDFLSYLSLINK
jgi:hypothetical protein